MQIVEKWPEMKCTYYKNITNTRVLIASPLPKPFGGIAVHALRLQCELEQQGNKVVVYQAQQYTSKIKRFWALTQLIIDHNPTILISHTSYHGIVESIIFIALRLLWFKQWILVDHDCRYLYKKTNFFVKMHRIACKIADCVVLMGTVVKDLYEAHCIKPRNYLIDNPYISPNAEEIKQFGVVPAKVDAFIKMHQKTILVNGSYFMKDHQNRDVYGFDTAIQLLKHLNTSDSSIGLIIMLGSNNDQTYFSFLQNEIHMSNLTSHVLWLIGDYYLPAIVCHVSCMIRPTISENFGISVAEAIDLGIPVVASDSCFRYSGALVYNLQNLREFQTSVEFVLRRTKS
jgi:glycosyltransferase involved in cell wall biosynthesis